MSDRVNRRDFLATVAAGSVAVSTAAAATLPNVARPNLLFILTDQWRFSSFGHSTDDVVRTPHIDQLGSEGAICRRAYAANPVCTPNRSCLLTGRYSHQTGMINNNLMLPPDEVCWPQIFADADYATHYIGKWHVDGLAKPGYVPPGWRRRGLQTFQGFNRGHIYHKPWGFDDDGSELVPKEIGFDPNYYEPAFQTDLAIRFMTQQTEKPFACYLSLGPPHTPFTPPKTFDLYTRDEIRLRPNVPRAHEQQARKDLAGYYGLCESLDHEVGRLMSYLQSSGQADNTLVVFTSDHGELAGSHGKYRKSEPEEESLHVPLVMRYPQRIKPGTHTDALVNSIDIMPSVLAMCGLKDPGTCSGQDLSAAIVEGGTTPERSAIYCEGKLSGGASEEEGGAGRRSKTNSEATGSWRSIVTDQYKLTVRGGERQVAHLFDLKNDPFEQNNLAKSPQQRQLVSELTDQLLSIRDSTGDTWPNVPKAAEKMYEK